MHKIVIGLIVSCFCVSAAFSQDYFPLREGNKWSYVISGGITLDVQVTGYAEINGVRCAIVSSITQSSAGTTTSKEYMSVDKEGLKVYLSQTEDQEIVYDPPLVRIKLPFVENQIWTSTIEQGDMDYVTTFRTLGTKQIQTNIGNFQCIGIGSQASVPGQVSMVSVSFYSDGVGLIRQEMQIGNQSINAVLVSANVKPTEKIEAPKPAPIKCPSCGASISSSAKFCPECGEKINVQPSQQEQVTSEVIDPNDEAEFDLFESPLRKLLLYKPRSWNVPALQYDNGVNVTPIVRPDGSALVVFIAFPVEENANDSLGLARRCINLFSNQIPDIDGTNVKTSSGNDLTTMDINFSEGDSKGIGHGYFFSTDRGGTAYLLLSRDDIWQKIRPTLVNIASNIAYSTQDVELVMNRGLVLADEIIITEQEQIPNPAYIIKSAAGKSDNEIELNSSDLTDKSITLDIPKDWYLEGQKQQFVLTDNDLLKNCGMISQNQRIIPTPITNPGVINLSYHGPSQILSYVFKYEDIGTDMEILCEIPNEQVNPEIAKAIKDMRIQRYNVDSRLIYAKFENIVTEKTFLGIFSVQCIAKPMSTNWEFSINGCWAPEDEFEDRLPLFLQISRTIEVNQEQTQNENSDMHQFIDQLNRSNLLSIADTEQEFAEKINFVKNNLQKRDYQNWILTQTTLGQGIWITQYEGAEVHQAESWGIEDSAGGSDIIFYNKAEFTESRPWEIEKTGLEDSQEKFDQYLSIN